MATVGGQDAVVYYAVPQSTHFFQGNVSPQAANTYTLSSSTLPWLSANISNGIFSNVTVSGNAVVGGTVTRVVPVLALYLNTTQNVSSATNTIVLFDTTDSSDSQGATGITYASGVFTNGNGYTVVVSVTYGIGFGGSASGGNSTGIRVSWLQTSTGRYGVNEMNAASDTNSSGSLTGAALLTLAAGATFSLYCYQNSGSTISLLTGLGVNTTGSSVQVAVL